MRKYFFLLFALGCSSNPLKSNELSEKESWLDREGKTSRYSSQDRLPSVQQREYVRMTRERLERENEIGAQAGSMWVMDGQGSYLFVQNKVRKEGDLLNIKLEGPTLRQVEMKVSVIRKLLDQIDEENRKFREGPRRKGGLAGADESSRNPAATEKKDQDKLDVESIPSRIVEILPDGSYRVTGQQGFILGQKDFKVLVTGLIRAEDFSDEGVSSNKLIEPDLDVLSVRKKKGESL